MVQSKKSTRRHKELTPATAAIVAHSPVHLLTLIPEQMLELQLSSGRTLELKVSPDAFPSIYDHAKTKVADLDDLVAWKDLAEAKQLVPKDPAEAKQILRRLAWRHEVSQVAEAAEFLLRNFR